MPSFNKPAKKKKTWRRIVTLLVIIFLRYICVARSVSLDTTVILKPGENVSRILSQLSKSEQLRVKIYLFAHKSIDFTKLEAGTYTFSGSYSRSELIKTILAGPTNKYIKITVLEWRSIYDIDASLTKKWIINQGEYIALVTDPTIISKYQAKYPFLQNLESKIQNPKLETLEGFLYPDTYNVDAWDNIADQLAYLQLENFKKKVRDAHQSEISSVNRYQNMILASIVEKEERNNANKATVAGIFFKRLNIWMKLDADITLCYGLHQPYASCTPNVIAKNIDDKNNPYNTRQNRWLTPQPISNPTVESIVAVLHPQASDYLFYLHGSDGTIHYGRTLEEHNANKAQYLK